MITKLVCHLFDKEISIETGHIARQANGAVMVRAGDTIVLVTATASKTPREGAGFFPLTVDFQEKFYAAGRIPGGFFKREARPSSKATLTARLIDRPIRPLFPKGYLNDVHVVATTLSVDGENEPDILALVGASAALTLSDIPFSGPIAAIRVGRIEGQFVCNPTPAQQKNSDIEFLVAGSKEAVTMVEGGAKAVPEKDVLESIMFAHQHMQALIQLQEDLRKKCGRSKASFSPKKEDASLLEKVQKLALPKLKSVLHIPTKRERSDAIDLLRDEVIQRAIEGTDEVKRAEVKALIADQFESVKKKYARAYTLDHQKRIDGRPFNVIRSITSEVGVLPRTHGSAIFTRGETQAIVVVTLGTAEDQQRIDSIEGESKQSFMLHYNFPPFSVGEPGFLRGPGRREIGHGSLAERALKGEIPSQDVFPYTVRIVSEITESNGSSSMASVCGGTLAMMDAGIPIQSPIAGIAMGLIKEGDQFAVLSDILGDEDGFGDMDFKVTGTDKGVTALQMDIKIQGIHKEILGAALEQAREGRLFILGKMKEAISEHRKDISPHAPRIFKITVPKDKIRDVIGSGGKVIRNLIEVTGAKIDVDDDGVVSIASADENSLKKAIQMVKDIIAEPEIGKIYLGTVRRIVDFGAFVEILPNKDGLLHVSEIAHERVRSVSDYLKEGDKLEVKVLDVDRAGKVRLSRRALLEGGGERQDEHRGERQGERQGGERQDENRDRDQNKDKEPIRASGERGGREGSQGSDRGYRDRGQNRHFRGKGGYRKPKGSGSSRGPQDRD